MNLEPWQQKLVDLLETVAEEDPSLRAWVTVLQEVFEFSNGVKDETDRGCALVVIAHLDVRLGEVLRRFFVDDASVARALLSDSRSGLAAFYSRIELAYLLGLIGPLARDELHILRRVRNDFAHGHEPLTFTNDRVLNRIRASYAYKGFAWR